MSLSSIIDQGTASQDWVNLRANTLTIDGSLIISPTAQNVFAGSTVSSVVYLQDVNQLLAANFTLVEPSDIAAVGIDYVGANISVASTGYYLINCKISGFINSFSTAEKFYLQFKNGANILLQDFVYINDSSSHSMQINRLVKLEEGQTYQLYFNQDTAQAITLNADSSSYLSIVKLY